MSELPKPVMVSVKLWQSLHAAARNMEASQQALNLFTDRIRGQIAASNQEARNSWQQIKADHPDLDLDRINWEPGDTPGQLIPVAMRFMK